jgi:glycosyltransferase involved in cell wall biosynthesis
MFHGSLSQARTLIGHEIALSYWTELPNQQAIPLSGPPVMGGPTSEGAVPEANTENANRDVWVVVPCFNEAAVVGDVVARLRQVFPHVVCVDDGSDDDSATVMRASGARVVRHAINLGQGAALQTGICFALADPCMRYVVSFDADGQHRVQDAADMVTRARAEGLDVLMGSRFLGSSTSIPSHRALLLRAGAFFERLTTGVQLTDSHNGLRVMSRRFVTTLDLRLSGMAHASELLAQVKRQRLPYAEHPVTIDYTPYSQTKGQRPINAINIAFDVLVNKLLRGGRS